MQLKPKEYSTEERESYSVLVQKITEVFTSINLRQVNMDPSENKS